MCAWWVAAKAAQLLDPVRRARWSAILPLLVLADLLSAHWVDVPTVDPAYWTVPPETARRLKANPNTIRILGVCDKASGEPGYASEKLDFMPVRDPLAWSLAPVWHVNSSNGLTPMISRRLLDFAEQTLGKIRYDLEGDTHLLAGPRPNAAFASLPNLHVGSAYVYRNSAALPRARLVGRPVYADDRRSAIVALNRLGEALRDQLVVEDPDRPLPPGAVVDGKARISDEIPERVVIETQADMPAYLVVSDTFDPGWSATVDGRPAPIRPAYLAFRAVFLAAGNHTVVFSYRPAGFELGLTLTACGVVFGVIFWFWPAGSVRLVPEHYALSWPVRWRQWWFATLALIVILSAVAIGPGGRPQIHTRWKTGVHQHTWGAGIAAMKLNRK